MKLYDNKMANSPRKVRMFISEKNIKDVEMVEIDIMTVSYTHLTLPTILLV